MDEFDEQEYWDWLAEVEDGLFRTHDYVGDHDNE